MRKEITVEDVKTISATTVANDVTSEIVMPDECGDTLWDAVLAQEHNTLSITTAINNAKIS